MGGGGCALTRLVDANNRAKRRQHTHTHTESEVRWAAQSEVRRGMMRE